MRTRLVRVNEGVHVMATGIVNIVNYSGSSMCSSASDLEAHVEAPSDSHPVTVTTYSMAGLDSGESDSSAVAEQMRQEARALHEFMKECSQNGAVSESLRKSHRKMYKKQQKQLQKLFTQLQLDLNACIDRKLRFSEKIESVRAQAVALRQSGIENQRVNAATLICCAKKQMKLEDLRSQALKRDIEQVVDIIDFLGKIDCDTEVLPIVDVSKLKKSFAGQKTAGMQELEWKIRSLKAKSKELVEQKPGSGDWYFNLMHPKSRTGMIVKRFEDRIDQLTYDDIYAIIEHLSSEKDDFSRLEDLLFDIGWQHKAFPFGFVRVPEKVFVFDLVPAVFGNVSIIEQYQFTPCSILNRMEWPFKSVVDMVFEMLILTSPFEIAHVFWEVIQEAAKCMQTVLVERGMNPEDIEVDFDSLFPILVTCIFVFGIDEWMTIALYTISFNEQVNDDPQLQFAMTYLEGVVTQIISMDKQQLKHDSDRLVSEHSATAD